MVNIKNIEKGWKPMPTSFKILFVLFLIGIVMSLFQFNQISNTGFSLLGIFLTGTLAGVVMLLFNLIGIIFLISLWNRNSWGWELGVGYLIFGIINSLLGLLNVSKVVAILIADMKTQIPNMAQTMIISSSMSIIVSVVINIIFAVIIYRNKNYFKF